jgi:predicted RNase H-like HicB family nuclease
MQVQLTAVFKKVPEGYIGFLEELPGADTQGASLEETRANLMEALQLVLEANRIRTQESLEGQEGIRESVTITAAGSGEIGCNISKSIGARTPARWQS